MSPFGVIDFNFSIYSAGLLCNAAAPVLLPEDHRNIIGTKAGTGKGRTGQWDAIFFICSREDRLP